MLLYTATCHLGGNKRYLQTLAPISSAPNLQDHEQTMVNASNRWMMAATYAAAACVSMHIY